MSKLIKVLASEIKRIVLGNNSDCACWNCGYPMGCGDVAYIYTEMEYCSKSCVYQANEQE